PVSPALLRCGQGGLDLGRMVSVIVYDHDPIGLTSQMKATLYPGIGCERFPDEVHRHIQFDSNRNGHERIGDIVSTGHRQTEWTQIAPTELRSKLGPPLVQVDLCRIEVRRDTLAFFESIGLIAFHDVRKERPEPIIVGTQHSQSIERYLINKLEEGLVDSFHAAVVIKMFPVEIRDRGDGRGQTEKRPIALISFRHEELTSTK